MNRENFLDTVGKQYADEIHEAYLQCESGEVVDYKKLNVLLKKLMTHAKVDGLSTQEFVDIVKSTLSEEASQGLDFTHVEKAA